jgi:hypothetical protein
MNDKTILEIIQNNSLEKYEKLSAILKYLFVDIANISQDNYYILGSFAIRKERTISDLDINMDYNDFFKLKSLIDKSFGGLEIYNNQIRWFFDMTKLYNDLTNNNEPDFSIEAFQKNPNEGFPNEKFSLNYLKEHNGLDKDSFGHQFFKLETLLEWKQTMNRPKDQPDIDLIKKLLSPNVSRAIKTKKTSKRTSKKTSKRTSKKTSKKSSKKTSKKKSKNSKKK